MFIKNLKSNGLIVYPCRIYHRVKSYQRNFAVSFLFGTSSEFDNMDQCEVSYSNNALTLTLHCP